MQCDDYGRLDGRPAMVRSRCFPLRLDRISDNDVSDLLSALEHVGLLWFYQAAGRRYLQVTSWTKHQTIRAKHSKCPDPPADAAPCSAAASTCMQMNAYVPVFENRESNNENRERGQMQKHRRQSAASGDHRLPLLLP